MKEQNSDLSIVDILRKIISWFHFLLKKWKIIVLFSVLGALIGLVYAKYSKITYKAELIFALEEKGSGSNMSSYSSIASQFGIDLGGSGGGVFFGDNILELIKSRLIIEKTILTPRYFGDKKQLLINRYIEKNKLQDQWRLSNNGTPILFLDTMKRDNFTIQQDSVLFQIIDAIKQKSLLVSKVDKKLNMVTVSLTSNDELFAKEFTEALVQTVSTYYIETKTKKMRVTVNLLQNKVDSVRRELYGEMNTAAQNQDNNLNLIRSKARVPNARTQMNIQSLSAMYAELSKNLELSKFTLMREEPLIQIIDKPILPLKKNRVGKEKGILIGFILGGLLSVLYVFGNRFKDSLLNNYTK
jgi:hypothetical protein